MKILAAAAALALSLSIAGCVMDDDGGLDLGEESAAATTRIGFNTQQRFRTPAVVTFGGPTCPAGQTLSSLSFQVCEQPLLYNCTEYLCTNPSTGTQTMAGMVSGVNPSCEQDAMQTDECTNDLTIPEKAIPSRKQLTDMMPRMYDKSVRNAPLLGLKK